MSEFPKAVNSYFNFLTYYDFSVSEKVEIDSGVFGNGYFTFKSKTIGIEIVLDRGQVLMSVGRSDQKKQDWLDWSQVLAIYAPNLIAYDFELTIDSQVKRLSDLLKKYCKKLLEGDFGF